jgi:RNA polymerase sigma factor (sigma-70 family)
LCGFTGRDGYDEIIMADDAELLSRYAGAGSEDAFAELVRRHLDLVYSVALRQTAGDAQLAQDVSQIVFIALARKAPALAKRPTLGGWLYRSAQFAAIDLVRRESRRRSREKSGQTMHELTANPAEHVDWEKVRPVLDQAIGELSDRDRDAVLLRFINGWSFGEIGNRLRLTENGARMRVQRALDKLQAQLTTRGITSTTTALTLALASQASTTAPAGLAGVITGAALASTGGAITAASFLLMSTTKTLMAGAGIVALVAIGTAVHYSRRVDGAEEKLAILTRERDDLRARFAATQRSVADRKGVAAPSPMEQPPSALTSFQDAAKRVAAWQATSPINSALERPEARTAFVQQEVLRARARFERFFRADGVTEDKQMEIEKHLRNYAEAMLDYYSSVRAQGFGPMNPPEDPKVLLELLRMEEQVTSDFARGVRNVLGDAGAKRFADYQRGVPENNVADRLAGQLSATETPLTAPQALQLIEILKVNRYDKNGPPSPGNTLGGTFLSPDKIDAAMKLSNLVNGSLIMPGRLAWQAPVTDAALAQAQTILSPAQLAALRQLQAEQLANYSLAPPVPKGATPEQALALFRKQSGMK